MVLHKFALLGGKVPAATGRRAGELRSPRRLRRRACGPPAAPRKPCPHRVQLFSACFYRKVFAFCGLCFFADFALFAAGTERIAHPRKKKRLDRFSRPCRLSILRVAVGKNSPHPRKGKPMGRFYPPSSPVDFGPLQWGRIAPIPAKKSDWIVFSHPRRLSILGLCDGEE